MVLRRIFLRWLFPAAFVLPLWLFVGWIVFSGGSGWALLWLFIAAPAVFVTQIITAFLVRARGSVRAERSASWRDVIAIAAWQVVVVALGFYDSRTFFPLLVLSVVGAFVLLWSSLAQLWNEARGGVTLLRAADGTGYIPPTREQPRPRVEGEVIVITENPATR
ncbi:MFS transporter permease [Microbacterium sp. SLBN-111]|uniref:MFS transporter permease n=1 Tax=Microbacterium sp. SLBN-111 TaxID=3377733 RepID=UPI003C7821F1